MGSRTRSSFLFQIVAAALNLSAVTAGVVSSFEFVFETTNLPSLRNAGQVAFQHSSSILRWEPGSGTVTTIASSGNAVGTRTIDSFFATRTSINDAGIVAFRAGHTGSSGGILVGDGSTLTEIAFDSFASDLGARPRVNNLKQVIYTANGGQDIRREVIVNPTITTIATDSEFGFTPSATPAMNSNGDVVFQGNRISSFEQGENTESPSAYQPSSIYLKPSWPAFFTKSVQLSTRLIYIAAPRRPSD